MAKMTKTQKILMIAGIGLLVGGAVWMIARKMKKKNEEGASEILGRINPVNDEIDKNYSNCGGCGA